MRKRLLTGLTTAALVAGMSVPATGLATKGGHSNSKKTCPAHRHSGKHHGTRGKRKGASRGKKCDK